MMIAADEPEIKSAASDFEQLGVRVEAVEADLSTLEGVDKLCAAIGDRPVAALLANAGRGLGKGFLDQDFDDIVHVVNTNITGTIYLIQKVGRDMRERKSGRILITGSIAGFMPGTYQAVYAFAREELDWWGERLGRDLPDGMFGENLTTRGLAVDEALVGEQWAVGDEVLLQVTAPRIPCATFATRMGEPRWVKQFSEVGRSGAYLAVVRGTTCWSPNCPGPICRPGSRTHQT